MSVRDVAGDFPGAEKAPLRADEEAAAANSFGLPRWKRAIDLVIGGLALVLLSPLMLATAAVIRLTSPGPALFRQARIGLNERPFMIFKFRTMQQGVAEDERDRAAIASELSGAAEPRAEDGLFRRDDDRVTPIGAWLRRLSIDELPQLFNVLRGEMSLVGPRPALPWEVEMFTREQRRRHARPPGMTGLWQVTSRNRTSTRDMLDLDLRYVELCSPLLDLAILARTPAAVLFHQNTR
jgi:lipopolysaccharide/colanic/teichoic acid biosynthesis glycosyltransferase